MTTPYTAVDITHILESAQGYLDLVGDIDRVRGDLDNDMPDLTDAFGDDEYGHKAIPTVQQGKQQGDDLFTGVRGMIRGGGRNLVVTGQSFGNANDTNEGLVKSFNLNP